MQELTTQENDKDQQEYASIKSIYRQRFKKVKVDMAKATANPHEYGDNKDLQQEYLFQSQLFKNAKKQKECFAVGPDDFECIRSAEAKCPRLLVILLQILTCKCLKRLFNNKVSINNILPALPAPCLDGDGSGSKDEEDEEGDQDDKHDLEQQAGDEQDKNKHERKFKHKYCQ